MEPNHFKIRYRLALSLAALMFFCNQLVVADDNTPPAEITFAKDVAPIVNAKCVACHRPGQIAPMSFTNYKDIRPWVKAMKKQIAEGTMPPWFADASHGIFANDNRLSDEEKDKVLKWIDSGAPLGDVQDLPPVPKFRDDKWKIGTPDAVFTMPKPYTLADNIEDHYQDFIVPTGLTEDKWLTKIELRPGNLEMVHHILIFALPPDGGALAGFGDQILTAALLGGGLLTKYAPGNNPDVFPPGYGKLLPAHSKLLFQVHYHKQAGAGTSRTDQSSLGVIYSKEPVKNPVTTAWILNPMINIPAGAANVRATSTFLFEDDGHIQALFPHMHMRGKSFKFEAVYPDGKRETLLDVPRYDFDWQFSYLFKEPKVIPKGTKIVASAAWDNSSGNAKNPDPNANLHWGEATTDEMMLGLMDYTYDTAKDSQGMIGLPEGMMAMVPPELRGLNAAKLKQATSKLGDLGAKLQNLKLGR